ncbi:hypothetical protein GQ53DRAFT_527488 [Thozetella sp. PMI_491]|nr:hypothetical protein GQ53DRAFT_527488 [Thozetella sp. PMI_491]
MPRNVTASVVNHISWRVMKLRLSGLCVTSIMQALLRKPLLHAAPPMLALPVRASHQAPSFASRTKRGCDPARRRIPSHGGAGSQKTDPRDRPLAPVLS